MVKEKRILSYFIGWLVLGFIICFIGITKTYAATYYLNYQYKQQYYDNLGSSVNAISTTWNESLQSYVSGNITTVANSYGAGLSISSPIPIISNHTYSISIYFDDISNVAVSSKSNIAISISLDGAAQNYASNQFWANTIQSNVNNNRILQFVFTANGGASFIFIPWTTTSRVTQSYVTTQIVMEDLGSEGISQNDINNSLNNQTNELNNSINNSTNTITDSITNSQNNINSNIQSSQDNINQNIDDMEQSIVDSNNQTQEVIKDQFNDCSNTKKIFSKFKNGYLTDNGVEIDNSSYFISNYINIKPNKIYQFDIINNNNMNIQWGSYCIYNKNKELINCYLLNNENTIYSFTSPNNGYYFRTTLFNNKDVIDNAYIKGEICNNKIDDTNNKLDGIQGALTDSSAPNTSGLENSAGWLPAGPLDSILNLPLTMLNSLTNSLGKTCAPLNLTLPYVNKNIQIPCLSAIFAQITGVNGLWTWVGTIASVLILYNYLLNLYAWVDRVLTLRAEFDEAMGADMANWGRL